MSKIKKGLFFVGSVYAAMLAITAAKAYFKPIRDLDSNLQGAVAPKQEEGFWSSLNPF